MLTRRPTAVPTLVPTFSKGVPTPSPTVATIKSIKVSHKIKGIPRDDAESPKFKNSCRRSAAEAVRVPVDDVTVVSVTFVGSTRRLLEESEVDIVYAIATQNGNTTEMSSSLETAIESGSWSESLQLDGFPNAFVGPVVVEVTSPTYSPTFKPTREAKAVYASKEVIIGTTIGAFFFALFSVIIGFFLCKRAQSGNLSPTTEANVRQDTRDFVPPPNVNSNNTSSGDKIVDVENPAVSRW
jgi:hypothetical protein